MTKFCCLLYLPNKLQFVPPPTSSASARGTITCLWRPRTPNHNPNPSPLELFTCLIRKNPHQIMDYASIHGQDESNFTFRSQRNYALPVPLPLHEYQLTKKTDRLPTESAAAALNALIHGNGKSQAISLGKDMEGVDRIISDVGGVRRGVVTEIWGPPGVGKTSFGYVSGRHVS